MTARALFAVIAVTASVGIALAARHCTKGLVLRAEDQETGRIYAETPVEIGDTVEFDWIHSFEHIPWKEYYTIKEDGTFYLETISVAGFGAGIPAEMDVDYRYEDGLIYMDHIGSEFDRFNFFNSDTALEAIQINDVDFIKGSDMPYHAKITVYTAGK
ncbi:MAG: DUF1850 domain-containing protein [Stomatobaculum sp.]|nr:DUF1850 domain-containing protein [Stomatobaculum sp.]